MKAKAVSTKRTWPRPLDLECVLAALLLAGGAYGEGGGWRVAGVGPRS
jgi:hypothetical protein